MIRHAASGAVAAILIAGLMYGVGWSALISTVTSGTMTLIAAGFILCFTGLVLLGLAWVLVLKAEAEIGLFQGLGLFFATFFMNSITPLGQFGGEPFIAWLVTERTELRGEESLGVLVIADFLNALAPFGLGLVAGIAYLLLNGQSLQGFLVLLLVGLVLLLTVVWIVVAWRDVIPTVSRTVVQAYNWLAAYCYAPTAPVSKTVNRARRFVKLLQRQLKDHRALTAAAVCAFVSALVTPVAVCILIAGLTDAAFSPLLVVVAIPVGGLAGFLPLPGGLGGIEVATTGVIVGLSSLSLPVVSGAILLYRAATFWLGGALGGGMMVYYLNSPST